MVLKSIEISYLLGVALSVMLLLASFFLLVKVVRNNSFTFVRTQSIWCIFFAASYIALNLLNFVYYDKNSGWKQLSVYILGFSYAYATFIIFWNITLQYLVTSKQLERILKHNEGTEDPQVVIEKMQDDNMFYKKQDLKIKIVLAVVVLLASIFDWLSFRSKEGQCWLILAILMSLIEVSLAVGILSFMFWALVQIKRANEKYFQEAETKTISINLAIAAIKVACFLSETVAEIIAAVSFEKIEMSPAVVYLYIGCAIFNVIASNCVLFVLIWVYYSFVVKPAEKPKDSQLIQEDKAVNSDDDSPPKKPVKTLISSTKTPT